MIECPKCHHEFEPEKVEYGDKDINFVVNSFKDTFGTTKTTKYDRFAASRLIKKYDAGPIVSIMSALAKRSEDQFAPVVNSVSQFETKLPSIIKFLYKGEKKTEEIDI
jgi:hypothetical protein